MYRCEVKGKNVLKPIIIGAMKAGTTSLHDYLSFHPEIPISEPNELYFFLEEANWGRGLEWYESHFAEAAVRVSRAPATPCGIAIRAWQGESASAGAAATTHHSQIRP